jgi:plastocyanin
MVMDIVHRRHRSRFALLALVAPAGLLFTLAQPAQAQPRRKPAPVTRADIERLDKRIEEQQRRIDKLVKLQLQYLQTLTALSDGAPLPPAPPLDAPVSGSADPKADGAKPAPAPSTTAAAAAAAAADRKARPVAVEPPRKARAELGTVVGKVTGAPDAIVYVEDIVATARGTAVMKQENKQFLPRVLVVQKGTTVQFPNMDALFHNVFSVTPESSFDLGSYRQGESKGVTMSKPGVVSVYCNMHPQMVGYVLVVPNGNYAHAGKDGFFRLQNIPAGRHRIVAWAPDAKPVVTEAEVSETEPVTIELELKKGRGGLHMKKDGLPYGSYEK